MLKYTITLRKSVWIKKEKGKKAMYTHYPNFNLTRGIFLIVLAGVFMWDPIQGFAKVYEDSPRNNLIEGPKDKGPKDIGAFIIEGEVKRVQGEFVGKDFSKMKDKRYVVETPYGREWDLHLKDDTQIMGHIFVGDHVKASMANDGSLQIVQKIGQDHPTSKHSMVRRSIKGILERKNGNFLYVKQGDHTEIVHLDPQSVLEGNIHEGTNIVAQLGEAGYGIKIKEVKEKGETNKR